MRPSACICELVRTIVTEVGTETTQDPACKSLPSVLLRLFLAKKISQSAQSHSSS